MATQEDDNIQFKFEDFIKRNQVQQPEQRLNLRREAMNDIHFEIPFIPAQPSIIDDYLETMRERKRQRLLVQAIDKSHRELIDRMLYRGFDPLLN